MSRVKLLGYEIDTFTFDGAVERALELEKEDKVSQVVTINPEMFDCAKTDSEFAEILNTSEMVIPDGVGVKIGLKILGESVDRIAGIDFARRMLELSAQNNLPVAIIGAKPEVINLAGENLKKEISEELSADILSFSKLGSVVSNSGLSSDKADVFCCEITKPTLKSGYESIVDLVFLNRNELKQWIYEEKIEDGFTLSALLLYLSYN